jgi:16S rRNA processing protein RimM
MSDKPLDQQASTDSARTGEPRAGSPSRVRSTNPRRRTGGPRRLSQTRGPEPSTSLDDVRLAIGTIGGTHGVRGELKLKLLTDRPEHLTTIRRVYLGSSDEPIQVNGLRFHGDDALISLAGVDNPEEGKKLGGLTVRIAGSDAKPLEEGEYFLFQLIGLRAETEDGTEVGEVTDLLETGAHDVLVIQPTQGGEDILIPNHPEYVVATEPEAGRIIVRVPVYRD